MFPVIVVGKKFQRVTVLCKCKSYYTFDKTCCDLYDDHKFSLDH